MKMMKRLLTAAMTLCLAAGIVYPAFAETYDVTNDKDIQEAVSGKNNKGDDKEVVLNVQNDIDCVSNINTVKDWTYTFEGNGHTVDCLEVFGEGSVVVNGDIDSTWSGVVSHDQTTVTVTGDIHSEGAGVEAYDESKITVTGNITTNATGAVVNNDAEVTVTGDIQGVGDSTTGATVSDHGKLTVNGSIDAEFMGLDITNTGDGTATAEITGDITSECKGVSVTAGGEGNVNVTVTGDISACAGSDVFAIGAAVDIRNTGNQNGNGGRISYTQTGDINSGHSGFAINSENNSAIEAEITGDINCSNGNSLIATNNSKAAVTVNGDTKVTDNGVDYAEYQEIPVVFEVAANDPGTEVSLTCNGNIQSEKKNMDAVWLNYAGDPDENVKMDVVIQGEVDLETPECGIQVSVDNPEADTNLTITGNVDYPIYTMDKNVDHSHVHITVNTPVTETVTTPDRWVPGLFQGEDLDGHGITSNEQLIQLIYFDPADPESISVLQQGQENFEKGSAVYAVCMTQDYEAARAAMKKAEAEYPVLKISESFRSFLGNSGRQAPVCLALENSGRTVKGQNVSTTTYIVTNPQVTVLD